MGLNFNCFLDILRIKYTDKNKLAFDVNKGIKMSPRVQLKWNVDAEFMAKKEMKKIFYSRTFDHCYCLYWIQNIDKYLKVYDEMHLQLLKLPVGVRAIEINYKCVGGEYVYGARMSYYSKDKKVCVFDASDKYPVESIDMKMEIVKIFDMNDREI